MPDEDALPLENDEWSTEVAVVDDASSDQTVVPERYDISSYGADPDVEGLVRRLDRGDILIPTFQRDYIWKLQEASRFVESLILGLPVPGIFLAVDPATNKQLVIDGQQRLRTLQFYIGGLFNPKPDDKTHRVFRLSKVQKQLDGKSYQELDDKDRLKLNAAVIHATIIKQESPADDDTSIYHVFERLNNGGRRLTDEEIRTALYHGPLLELVRNLNDVPEWRRMFGEPHRRLKDQELVLRFLALTENHAKYAKPMKEFLNRFAQSNRYAPPARIESWRNRFIATMQLAQRTIGDHAFRYGGSLNAAVFDSVAFGLSEIGHKDEADANVIRAAYGRLLEDSDYRAATTRATSDEAAVEKRLNAARAAFAPRT